MSFAFPVPGLYIHLVCDGCGQSGQEVRPPAHLPTDRAFRLAVIAAWSWLYAHGWRRVIHWDDLGRWDLRCPTCC